MIKQLKIKFIVMSMLAVTGLLVIIVVGMNLINYNATIKEADMVLELLSHNKGSFPNFRGDKNDGMPHNMHPELPYESRYFSVLINKNGNLIQINTGKIASVNSSKAIKYAQEAVESNSDKGFADEFRYIKYFEGDNIRITFLDCGRKLDLVRQFVVISIGMALVGLFIVFWIIFLCSGRIIKPMAESYKKQKAFITDAGHEIKTPLTIISANVDLIEMESGNNECLCDIRQQTKRLCELTDELVSLARMEEDDKSMKVIDFPLSDVVMEAVLAFKTPARNQKKEIVCEISPLISLKGNDKKISQLVNILMDNALKYSPENSRIIFEMSRQNRMVIMSVINTATNEIDRNKIKNVFDRFYRMDSSRNSQTGGHGIGLSLAKAIVTAHNGKITADSPDGHLFRVTVSIPV